MTDLVCMLIILIIISIILIFIPVKWYRKSNLTLRCAGVWGLAFSFGILFWTLLVYTIVWLFT
jgi:hypothetical protein